MEDQQKLFELVQHSISVIPLSEVDIPESTARAAFAKSMKTLGNLSAICVRSRNGRYEILDGRRRAAEAQKLGHETIAAVVVSEETSVAEAAAITAAMNYGQTPSIFDEAFAIKQMIDAGFDENAISSQLGINKSTIRKRLKLIGLPDAIKVAVLEGNCAATTAESIAGLDAEYHQKAVTILEQSGKLTGGDIAEIRANRVVEAVTQIDSELLGSVPAVSPVQARLFFLDACKTARRSGLTVKEMRDIISEAK